MCKIYQFHKIPYIFICIFILYISFFTNKCQSILEYLGLLFFTIGVIFVCGFTYSFDNNSITKYWYIFKRRYSFSEIQLIVSFNSNKKMINVYFKLNLENKAKIIEYTKKYMDYSDGIRISYWLQKKKMNSMINLIIENNPKCLFVVNGEEVPADRFLDKL